MKVVFLIVCHPEDVSEDSLRELLQQTLANNLVLTNGFSLATRAN